MIFNIACTKAPAGATWLLNILISLGYNIMRDPKHHRTVLKKVGSSHYELDPHEAELRLQLPILSEQSAFTITSDHVFYWSHGFPHEELPVQSNILFVRDPRDCLYSYYKRRNAKVSFHDFLGSIDPYTGFSQMLSHRQFWRNWLDKGVQTIIKFEDCKEHPEETIIQLFADLKLTKPSVSALRQAINSSNISNVKRVENTYNSGTIYTKWGALSRAGIAREWQSNPEFSAEYDSIACAFGDLLRIFDYPVAHGDYDADHPMLNQSKNERASRIKHMLDQDGRYGQYTDGEKNRLREHLGLLLHHG